MISQCMPPKDWLLPPWESSIQEKMLSCRVTSKQDIVHPDLWLVTKRKSNYQLKSTAAAQASSMQSAATSGGGVRPAVAHMAALMTGPACCSHACRSSQITTCGLNKGHLQQQHAVHCHVSEHAAQIYPDSALRQIVSHAAAKGCSTAAPTLLLPPVGTASSPAAPFSHAARSPAAGAG